MLNICLDITRLLTRRSAGLLPTGVDRVGLAYLEHYRSRARAVISRAGFPRILNESASSRAFNLLTEPNQHRFCIRSAIVKAYLDPRRVRPGRAVLLHTSHNGMEHVRYYRAMHQRDVRAVFMIHDLIPLTHAEYCRPGVEAGHRQRIHTALRHADGLIANSEDTHAAIKEEARRASLTMPPCVVAPLAAGYRSVEPTQAPLQAPYFVMLGTIEPRKNHWFMLHVWRRLVEQWGSAAPKLVIIGRRGWECENVVDMLERCTPLKDTVIELADCTDAQLHAWLQHARALLFPSFVEGYGMPLVEALSLKVPVLASNLAVFREIAADIPDYLDPLDGPAWIARILAYTRVDGVERSEQLARITGFHEPTWASHFERVDQFVDSLA
ncbi:glycosyltransferase family 1 protein [Burkholderia sp. BCC0044]|uniref:glycosyltransferase family 4 protein n=1 Tax=Burkholderia sp. BCC0044 TaxID=2676295 RepID=UPI00158CF8C8|nr:glycosyltransferase family 1 protein [Burkholderia sp. BCC0044]